MADVNKTNCIKNGNVAGSPTAGAASQTIVVTKDERLVLRVVNGGGAGITATIPKGNGICSAAGDLAVTVAAGQTQYIGPLESARFIDTTTGKMTLNLSGTTSVTIEAIQL